MRIILIALAFASIAPAAFGSLLVSNYLSSTINAFDHNTGASQGVFAGPDMGVRGPKGMTIGPDGTVFVVMDDTSTNPETIQRFTQTGQPLGVFTTLGNNTSPNRLTFGPGPDRDLYVSFATEPYVRRYDGATGALIDNFAVGGGLSAGGGLLIRPDGTLLVSSYETGSVKLYHPTGEYISDFATGLSEPTGLVFTKPRNAPFGDLYVASRGTDQVKRYDLMSGQFLGDFAQGGGLDAPEDLAFGPDSSPYVTSPDSNLYVTSFFTNEIKRYNGTTGAFMDNFVPSAGGSPTGLLFIPQNVPEPSAAWLLLVGMISFLPHLIRHFVRPAA